MIDDYCPPITGTYYIWMGGYTPDDIGPYSLQVTEGSGGCAPACAADGYEPNEDRTNARAITCGTTVYGTICDGDEDFFRVSVSSSATLSASIDCESGGDDIDLFIQDTAGATLDSGLTSECHEEVSAPVASGTHYLRVRGYGGSASYSLDCEISAGAGCSDTSTCPSGNICNPSSGCVSDFCDDPGSAGECPAGHFCPEPGGIAGASACVDTCTSVSDCRSGYNCKAFEDVTSRGCGREGSGETGDHCEGFWECAGERTCLTAGSNGYCAEINCTSNSDCPTDAICVSVGGGKNVCLMDCLADDALCDPTEGTCVDTTDVDGWISFVCALSYHTLPDGGW